MKFFVTGGAGFIGSAVVRYLINYTNHTVINVDKLTYAGNLESLTEVEKSERYFFEAADICDMDSLEKIFRTHQPDVVMHLAAESHVDRSIEGPEIFISTNILGTFRLLEVSKKYWSTLDATRKKIFRFHHISTDEVFGDLKGSNEFFREDTPYAPSSPYSASKASSDHLVRAWKRTFGLPVIVTNCSNNYGPFQFPEKLIPLTIINAISGDRLPIYGQGTQVRDWLFVEDHARALVQVIQHGKVGATYAIGGHNEKKNIEVVRSICALLDELVPERPQGVSRYEELIEFVEDRPGHDFRYAIDASKIERELKWTPEESFETGLRKTVEWYLGNQKWVSNVLDGSYRS